MLNRSLVIAMLFIGLLVCQTAYSQTPACAPAPTGMVAWWPGEGNALDIRGGNNGTLQNGAVFTTGEVGQGFQFDGVGSMVAIPNSSSLGMTSAYSFDAWVNYVPNGLDQVIAVRSNTDFSGHDIEIKLEGNNTTNNLTVLHNRTNGGTLSSVGFPPVPQNTPFHLAVVYDGTKIHTYYNGVEQTPISGDGSILAPLYTNRGWVFGRTDHTDFGGQGKFKGILDEIELFDRALVSTEIGDIFNAGTAGKCSAVQGLAGWWPGDGDPRDISGNGNNGTLKGGTAFALGEVSQGFNFNGTDAYVTVPDSPSLDITNQITIDAWIDPFDPGRSTGQTFIALKGEACCANTQSFGLLWGTESVIQSIILRLGNSTTTVEIRSNAVIPLNQFTHVAGTYDGQTMRLYVNGVLDSSVSTTLGPMQITNSPLIIGSSQTNGSELFFFHGLVDELAIYNRALSSNEIQSIFNAGLAGNYKSAVTNNGSNVQTNVGSDATVTFPSVTTAGTTQQVPLDPATLPAIPNTPLGLTYDISTAAVFTGSPVVCFNLPLVTTSTDFSRLRIQHLESGSWVDRTNIASINFATRTVCTIALSSLSPFAIVLAAQSTAAGVTVSGHVTTHSGAGIQNVVVTLTNAVTGDTKQVKTKQNGFYFFNNVRIGAYVVSVSSKKYSFSQPQAFISVKDDTMVDFVATR